MSKSPKLNYTAEFLRIGRISGMYYTVKNRQTKRLVICGIGAPLPPDDGLMGDAGIILEYDTDLFVPDYIGYGRSDGIFTPLNTIKTFLELFENFTKGCVGVCNYTSQTKKLKYSDIHFMGRSFGGIYVLLLPRFNPKINQICSIFPVTDWSSLGKYQSEETIEGFMKAMTKDGYKYLYRGILSNSWKKHFAGNDDLNPIDNIKYLNNSKVFLGHGKKDNNIYFGHTVSFFNKLVAMFPNNQNQYKLGLYPYDHSRKTSNRAIVDYFNWMGIPKSK